MARPALVPFVLAAVIWVAPVPASAQDDEAIGISGSVEGALDRGSRASLEIEGTHVDGWRALDTLTIALELHGAELDAISFDVGQREISASSGSALLGTGDAAQGRFFQIRALDVSETTGGNRVAVTLDATVVETVPDGARFAFTAEGDDGREASVTRPAAVGSEADGGFPLVTLALAVIAALVAGGFVGSRVAADRRRRPSIYEHVARRIEEDRRARGLASRASRR